MAKSAQDGPAKVVLPSGRVLDLRGPRSKSLLDNEALDYCKAQGIALAYDPVQIGIVPADCEDDIADDLAHTRRGLPVPTTFDAPKPPGRIAELHQRYRLRRWASTDRETFVALLNDPAVWRYLPEPFPDPLTAETAAGPIELSNTSAHHDVMAIDVDGIVVGQVRLLLDGGGAEANGGEISYWLGKAHWGRGIASDVVELFTYHCFQQRPNLQSIVAHAHKDNHPSARALNKSRYRPVTQADSSGFIRYRIARAEVLPANLPH